MKVDELTPTARDFYERSLLKLTVSLMLAAFGMMFLGFSSISGGLSAAYGYNLKSKSGQSSSSDSESSQNALISSNGFSCSIQLFAFFVMMSAAVYISPLRSSPDERRTLQKPGELNSQNNPPTTTVPLPNLSTHSMNSFETLNPVHQMKEPPVKAHAEVSSPPVLVVVAPNSKRDEQQSVDSTISDGQI